MTQVSNRIEWCAETGNGREALRYNGRLFAYFPAGVRPSPDRLVAALDAWEESRCQDALTASAVEAALIRKGLLPVVAH